jgi:hypothetical protein
MTALPYVWVRGSSLELIRADRIVSLSLRHEVAGAYAGPIPVQALTQKRNRGEGPYPLGLIVSVADGGSETRDVHLMNYEALIAVPALDGLVAALGESSRRSSEVVIIYPVAGTPGWEITGKLPRQWTA